METSTKDLRIQYLNEWPVRFLFPAEKKLLSHLKDLNLATPFVPAKLRNSSSREFHLMLSSLLDALDMLPLRPDRSFECIWTALDAEMFNLIERLRPPGSPSRFQVFMQHIESQFASEKSLQLVVDFVGHAPLQSCEYIAVRILEALNRPGEHSEYFIRKVKPVIGVPLLDAFNAKYGPQWLVATGVQQGLLQRKAGGLLKKLMRGDSVDIGSLSNFVLAPPERLRFFVYAVLPNVRNERFHGLNFSSYRSSAAQMKTYAAGYFSLFLAYFLVIHTFIYNGFNVIDQSSADSAILDNMNLYKAVFGKFDRD